MKCPNSTCGRKIQVSDSREKDGGAKVKRRRRCNACHESWTTCEVIQIDQNVLLESHVGSEKKHAIHGKIYTQIIELMGVLIKAIEPLKNSL